MLTQLATVKKRLKIQDSDVTDDDLLTNFIKGTSARIENDCNRSFGYSAQTDEFQADETELRLSRYPLDENADIAFSKLNRRSDGWQDLEDVEFVPRKGCVISVWNRIGVWKEQIRVSYAGGYLLPGATAPDGTNPPALPDDIEQAVVEQCVYLYQNKDRLGVTGMSGQGGGFQQFSKLDLIPSVQAVVKKYERWMP
jgi:Phage gp6-like head-tail connector protein